MPTQKTNKAKAPMERPGTRAGQRESSPLEEQHDINDALQGRKLLEKHLLLCPAGEPATHVSLSTCLYQISALAGVSKTVTNAIRSVALLLEELEDTQINGIVKEAFDSQMTEFTMDMRTLIEDAKEKIDEHLKETEGRLNKMIDNVAAQPRQAQPLTYASILNTAPPHANPRVAAKEGIKARQLLLEGIMTTKFSHTDAYQLKTELNNILGTLGLTNGKIRSINKLRNGGVLVEMDSDNATTWMTDQENRNKFCVKIGPGVTFRSRVHSLIAFNVPLGINPEDKNHQDEVCEVNSLDPGVITTMRWAKPVQRRTPDQRTAHLLLTFNNPDAANRAITNGLFICNRRCHIERVKREPTRCLKCQGWNHFAKDCIEEDEKCGNCTKNHRTNDCPTPQERSCVSCKSDDHASWSRECPTFIRKLNEFNDRNPENTLQYIPTADPWTWTASTKPTALAQPPPTQVNRPYGDKTQHGRNNQAPTRRVDSYVPKYDSYVPNYDRTGKRQQNTERTNAALSQTTTPSALPVPMGPTVIPRDINEFRPLTQEYMNTINNEDPSRPTNPIITQPF